MAKQIPMNLAKINGEPMNLKRAKIIYQYFYILICFTVIMIGLIAFIVSIYQSDYFFSVCCAITIYFYFYELIINTKLIEHDNIRD